MPEHSLRSTRSTSDIAEVAQRLWILERPLTPEQTGRADVFCFMSALAVLAASEVGVGFIRSIDLRASTDACLRSARVRTTLERKLAKFPTLDTALAWAESRKRDRLERGWIERYPDTNIKEFSTVKLPQDECEP